MAGRRSLLLRVQPEPMVNKHIWLQNARSFGQIIAKWWFSKGKAPNSLNSDLGIIVICPDDHHVNMNLFLETSKFEASHVNKARSIRFNSTVLSPHYPNTESPHFRSISTTPVHIQLWGNIAKF